jgi:uncharacterized protein YaaW (UPF0174 family)
VVRPFRTRASARIDGIATAWGGLVASVGLMAGAGRDWPGRMAAAAVAFGLGGFLAGVRAEARRPAHALAAAVAGHLLYAGFAATTRAIDALGGPDAPALVPGTTREWAITLLWSLAVAAAGGAVAGTWLRPAGGRRR